MVNMLYNIIVPVSGVVHTRVEVHNQGVRKSLRDLVESQKRNTAQLERIGAAMEQRWGLEEVVRKEKSRDNMERSEDGPRKSQKEGTPSSASC